MNTKLVLIPALLASSIAWAQPTPTPTAAPADPAAPAPAATAPTPAPAVVPPLQAGINQPRTEEKQPVLGTYYDGPQADDGATTSDKRPTLAVELSLMGGGIVNQFVEYKGWTLKNGVPKGARLEGNFHGFVVAYELANMSNDQACNDTMCVSGDFGSTTLHMIDIGYRYRFGMIGPVRPYLAASLGAVHASFGDWSHDVSSEWGGSARGGVGLEVPLPANLFASAFVGYRLVVTPNPLRNADAEKANEVLVDPSSPPNGDYAEDLHSISGYVGVGMVL